MSLTDKLNEFLKEKNITKSQLSKESGVPYTTIDGFYKKGTDNVKLSTLKKLADYFKCSLDYLVDDKIEISNSEEENKETNQNEDAISIEEHKLLKNFNKLNKTGKDEAIKRVEELTYINKYIDANETKVDENSSYLNPVAAHDDNLTIEEKNRMDEIILKKLKELGKL